MIPEWKKHDGTTSLDSSPTSKDHKLQQTIHAQKGKGTQSLQRQKKTKQISEIRGSALPRGRL